jgi:hypothetical protein
MTLPPSVVGAGLGGGPGAAWAPPTAPDVAFGSEYALIAAALALTVADYGKHGVMRAGAAAAMAMTFEVAARGAGMLEVCARGQ